MRGQRGSKDIARDQTGCLVDTVIETLSSYPLYIVDAKRPRGAHHRPGNSKGQPETAECGKRSATAGS